MSSSVKDVTRYTFAKQAESQLNVSVNITWTSIKRLPNHILSISNDYQGQTVISVTVLKSSPSDQISLEILNNHLTHSFIVQEPSTRGKGGHQYSALFYLVAQPELLLPEFVVPLNHQYQKCFPPQRMKKINMLPTSKEGGVAHGRPQSPLSLCYAAAFI